MEEAIKDLNWTVEEKGNSFGFNLRGLGGFRSAPEPSSPSEVVYAKVGLNLWTTGERITVNLANKTIKSEAAAYFDFGKNKENVNKLKKLIDTYSAAGKKARKRRNKKARKRRKIKGYETLLLYESSELEKVIHDLDFRLRTFGHYVIFIQIYMAGVDGKVTHNESVTLKAHIDELIQGMINTTGASEWHAESYIDETMKDARSLYNKYKKTGKLDISYAVCIRQLARFAQGTADWLGPPRTRPTGPHLKALYSYLNDIAFADGDLDSEESEALQFADSEWSSAPGYAQYNPYQ